MLSSDNVNLRIVAGETIALLFELARDIEVCWIPFLIQVQIDKFQYYEP